MIRKQSISQNFFFQYAYQILILVIPLVLAPYLSRALRETALGVFSYANSIAAYFVAMSMLGIARHGQRIISENANDDIKLRKSFWSLFTVHIIVSIISLLIYLAFVVFFIKDNKTIFTIEALQKIILLIRLPQDLEHRIWHWYLEKVWMMKSMWTSKYHGLNWQPLKL